MVRLRRNDSLTLSTNKMSGYYARILVISVQCSAGHFLIEFDSVIDTDLTDYHLPLYSLLHHYTYP